MPRVIPAQAPAQWVAQQREERGQSIVSLSGMSALSGPDSPHHHGLGGGSTTSGLLGVGGWPPSSASDPHRPHHHSHRDDDDDYDMVVTGADESEIDNTRVLRRVEAAVADPTGRLRLLIDSTNATVLPGFEIAMLRGSLRELDCSHSPKLRALPMEIGHLHRTLTALDCSHCAIEALPSELSLLTNLKQLNCSHNRLRDFTWDCSNLISLTSANLSHNQLRFLSPSAAERLLLDSNAYCDLSGNEVPLRATATTPLDVRDALPPDVDSCSVCDAVDKRGTISQVYVQFIPWRPRDPITREPVEGSRSVLVPVLHPCCGGECAKALFAWQAVIRTSSRTKSGGDAGDAATASASWHVTSAAAGGAGGGGDSGGNSPATGAAVATTAAPSVGSSTGNTPQRV